MADDTESHSTGIRESRDTLPAEVVESALAVCQKATETCLSKILQIAIDDAISHILRDAGTGSIEEQQASHRIAGQLSDRLDAVRQHTFEEFELLFSGKKALHGDLGSTDEMDELGLSLVDHESLEHQIVIERVATRAQGDTKSDFSLLNRRFCLLKDRRIKPEDSPLSAKALTHCISQGVAACDIGVMGQLAVFRSIENFLGDQLKHLYLSLNAQLVELGVLPDIKHHIWRTDSTLRAGRARVDLAESQKAVLKEMRRPTQGEDLVALLKQLAGDPAASVVDEAGSPASESDSILNDYEQGSRNALDLMAKMPSESSDESLLAQLDQQAESSNQEKLNASARQVLSQVEALASSFARPFLRNPLSGSAQIAQRAVYSLAKHAMVDPSYLIDATHPLRKLLAALRHYADFVELVDARRKNLMQQKMQEGMDLLEDADLSEPEVLSAAVDRFVSETLVIRDGVRLRKRKVVAHQDNVDTLASARATIDAWLQTELGKTQLPAAFQKEILNECVAFVLRAYFLMLTRSPEALKSLRAHLLQLIRSLDEKNVASAKRALVSMESIVKDRQVMSDASISRFRGLVKRWLGSSSEQIGATDGAWPMGMLNLRMAVADRGRNRKAYSLWKSRLTPNMWMRYQADGAGTKVCRFDQAIGDGQRCVFVDGLGARVLVLSGADVLVALKARKLVPLNRSAIAAADGGE